MRFSRDARVSARIHESEKEKLQKSGYNVREAVEYFNSVVSTKIGALKIEEKFLLDEIEELQEFRSRVVSLLDGAIKLYGDVMTLKK